MTLYQRANMKDLLAQSLYLLMEEKPFEKITIKQISDKTGVIRGTFYHHFIDKYETLEYIVRRIVYDDIMGQENNDKFKRLFEIVYDNRVFFKAAFQIHGQNSFVSIMNHVLIEIFMNSINNEKEFCYKEIMSKDLFVSYYSHAVIFVIKYWINEDFSQTPDEIYQISKLLFTSTFQEIL